MCNPLHAVVHSLYTPPVATLSDIARQVGCSPATVSRALHGNPRISEATRKRVAEVAVQLNYRANATARSLRRGESRKVGLIIPDIRNSHYYEDTSLLHDALSAEGYRIILCCHRYDAAIDAEILTSLVEHEVDGLIHIPCTKEGAATVLGTDPQLPVVESGLRRKPPGPTRCIPTSMRQSQHLCAIWPTSATETLAYLPGGPTCTTSSNEIGLFRCSHGQWARGVSLPDL